MARKSDGTVYIDTLVDTQGFGTGVNTMKKSVGGLTTAFGKLGATIVAAFSIAKLVQFGKEAIDLGSDLEEVQNVVDVTFTTMSDRVDEFAKSAAEAAGLSEVMAKRYMGTFGAMSKSFGFMEEEAFAMSSTLTQAVGDVASFYNLTQDEAYTKLKSVFTGETESLKDLGVVMTQSALDSFAMAKGYEKTTKEMSEQEKVALRYSFVLDQLSASSGDFIRTQDSWANQMRISSLSFDTFKANVGQASINIFTPFLKVLNQVVERMVDLSESFLVFSEMLFGKQTENATDSLKEIENGYEDVADATGEATKAQNQYLTGLDEINTFSTNKNSKPSEILGGELITEPEDMIATEGTVAVAIDGLIEKLANAFKNGDWESLGGYLSDGIKKGLDKLSEKIDSVDWQGIGEDIGEFIKGIDWDKALDGVADVIFSALEAGLELWDGAFNVAPVETAIVTALAGMKITGVTVPIPIIIAAVTIAFAPNIAKKIAEWLEIEHTIFGDAVDELSWDYFWTKLSEGITNDAGEFDLSEAFDFVWFVIKSNFEETFELLKPVFSQLWTNIKKSTSESWTQIVNIVKGKINIMIAALNKMLAGITGGFNGLINVLNAFKIDVPDWAKDLTGIGSVGFNIQKITAPKIPYLATGAVIPPNAPFMAMLGDQKNGTNIEAPLSTIEQALENVYKRNNGGNGGQYQFTAQINRRTLFDEVIAEANLRQITTGRNPFELA